jgi:hypothetical protein
MKRRNASMLLVGFVASISSLVLAQENIVESKHDVRATLHADLTDNNIDPNFSHITTPASVIVNFAQNYVQLNIGPQCPHGALCLIAGFEQSAPITSISTDSCGVETIVASKDLRPVDGGFVQITVTDNSRSICEIVYPYMTVVDVKTAHYTRSESNEVTTNSIFRGKLALHPLFMNDKK